MLTDQCLQTVSLTKNLARNIVEGQAEAAATLRAAGRLAKDADLLLAISNEFSSAATSADKFTAAKGRLSDITQAVEDIEAATSPTQKNAIQLRADARANLVELRRLTGADSATDNTVSDVSVLSATEN